MKKIIGLMFVIFFGLTNMNAMSYEEARERARFLTDKMAYELNLNDEQYNDAYEINLDYLMNIRTANDISGIYWEYRNADLRHILYDWQYTIFSAADYFFRPVIWRVNGWFLPVCNIYPVTKFYYNPPRVYTIYRGGNFNYRFNHPVSFYANRRPTWHGGFRGESRGPVRRPAGRHPIPPTNNGFRFEPAPSFQHGDRKPAGNMSSRTGRTTTTGRKPTDNHTVSSRPTGTRENSSTIKQTNRPKKGTSTYNRPSSTRMTVKKTPQSSKTRMTRPQNGPNVQRSTNHPTTGKTTKTTQHNSAPSRSGR